MCGIKELFIKLNESTQGEVAFGDSSKILVKGKGNIMIQTKMEIIIIYRMSTLFRRCTITYSVLGSSWKKAMTSN